MMVVKKLNKLIKVCKKRKYNDYAIAYAFASASDTKLKVYYCCICNSHHLTSNLNYNEKNDIWD